MISNESCDASTQNIVVAKVFEPRSVIFVVWFNSITLVVFQVKKGSSNLVRGTEVHLPECKYVVTFAFTAVCIRLFARKDGNNAPCIFGVTIHAEVLSPLGFVWTSPKMNLI